MIEMPLRRCIRRLGFLRPAQKTVVKFRQRVYDRTKIGGWHDLSVGCSGMKKRLARKFGSEYDDYADEELYE